MNGQIWTKEEIAYLKRCYPYMLTEHMVEEMGRPERKIYSMAFRLGIKKSEAYMNSELPLTNHKVSEAGKAKWFQKGHVPFNKGKKMPDEVKAKVKHNWFGKGHQPHNTKHDGYISVRVDKTGIPYAYIRVAKGKFRLLHRVIWEQAHGKIPPGQIITFINGDQTDFNIENLELITKKQNMLRNSIQRFPDDLKQAIKALHKLKKTIKNYEKQRSDSTEKSHV